MYETDSGPLRYVAQVKDLLRIVKVEQPSSMEALSLWDSAELLALPTLRLAIVDFYATTTHEHDELGTVLRSTSRVTHSDYVVDLANTAVAVLTTARGAAASGDNANHQFLYHTNRLSGNL
jgi:hypothetical protein